MKVSAHEYVQSIDIDFALSSDKFVFQRTYHLRFSKSNFLHLTGLTTALKCEAFFDKCLNGSIAEEDISIPINSNKTTLKRKMKHLISISSVFNKKLLIQENFVKNKIICKIAISDCECTIGFIGGCTNLYPKTLLDKKHLEISKLISDYKFTRRKIDK